MNQMASLDLEKQEDQRDQEKAWEMRDEHSPLQLQVHGQRVLVGTIVLVTLLICITIVLIRGVDVNTLDASKLDDEARRAVLDRYNSYSSSLASIVGMPFQQLPTMLMPVFFLCFTTHVVMTEQKSFIVSWGPVIAVTAVSYMLGLGLSALNVQFDAPRIEFNMLTSDLGTMDSNNSNFSALNYLTSTTHVAGVPSTNTILRSAIVSKIKMPENPCTNNLNVLSRKPEASVRFGFPLNSWLNSLLPESITSSKSFTFSMDDDFTTKQVDATQFPNGNVQDTAMLLTGAFYTIFSQFAILTTDYIPPLEYNLAQDLKSSDAASLLTNIQNTIRNTTSLLMIDFNETSEYFSHSIDTPEITIELSSFQLSPQISFEAATFDLPVKTEQEWFELKNATEWNGNLQTCSGRGCILLTPNRAGTNQDQVRVLSLCTDLVENEGDMATFIGTCETSSNSSVLIYSLARHIVTDDGVGEFNNNYLELALENPRMRYRATVGRLSWTSEDLTSIYDSSCAEDANCNGLNFPLADGKRHLVLGEDFIPEPKRAEIEDPAQWEALVIAETQVDDLTLGDVAVFCLSEEAQASYNASTYSGEECFILSVGFIDDVIERHIYSRDPVQPAYTAALFWLFQNAVVKQIVTTHSSNSTGVRLLLDGNRPWIAAHATIPFVSGCFTFAGCGLILLLGFMIVLHSRDQNR